MYGIIEQLFEDLNSYCESFVALPETPHTNWIQKQLDKNKAVATRSESNSNRHNSNTSGGSLKRPAFVSRAGSNSSSGSEIPIAQLEEDAEIEARSRGFSHSSSTSGGTRGSNAALIALLSQTPLALSRRASTEKLPTTSTGPHEASTSTDSALDLASPISPTSGNHVSSSSTSSSNSQGTVCLSISRPPIGRSTTITAITNATVSTGTALSGDDELSGKSTLSSTVGQDSSNLSGASQSTSQMMERGKSADGVSTHISSNPLPRNANVTPSLASSIATAHPTRATSGGSNSTGGSDSGTNNLSESILSLRTIGAASTLATSEIRALPQSGAENGNKSTNTVKSSSNTSAAPKPAHTADEMLHAQGPGANSLPARREAPHGLGRTVRDAINLKLFPTYANPPPINDWDVPVALLRLDRMIDANWDLTMTRVSGKSGVPLNHTLFSDLDSFRPSQVCPFIDGINHVKRIAQMADADLELTRQCMEHLM